ncbi:hypothetical protein V1477_000098, partial [Vespula maculifrons]
NQLEKRYVIQFVLKENRGTKNRRNDLSLNVTETFGCVIKPFSFKNPECGLKFLNKYLERLECISID